MTRPTCARVPVRRNSTESRITRRRGPAVCQSSRVANDSSLSAGGRSMGGPVRRLSAESEQRLAECPAGGGRHRESERSRTDVQLKNSVAVRGFRKAHPVERKRHCRPALAPCAAWSPTAPPCRSTPAAGRSALERRQLQSTGPAADRAYRLRCECGRDCRPDSSLPRRGERCRLPSWVALLTPRELHGHIARGGLAARPPRPVARWRCPSLYRMVYSEFGACKPPASEWRAPLASVLERLLTAIPRAGT